MRAPLTWLRDYVDLPDDVDVIVRRLALLGFPVEGVDVRPPVAGVVAGRIDALAKHPNADRLQVCTVDVGAAHKLTIATAATNVAQGQVVPVATIGARLPHLTIEPRTMRGVKSEGMLVSAEELALEPAWFVDGILQLDDDTPLGADVVALFGLNQPVLDIEVTSNRPDALCMIGIARELAAAFGSTLRVPAAPPANADGDSADVRVTLESVDCRRYVAQRVSNVRVRPAPMWMQVRLALAGQRPISNLVDISNFVMLEFGQPLHFFDFERIGGRHIIVRDARPGETLVTLDGVERALDATALVIADGVQPTGLAGLMGGSVSEVSEATREIVIESANFSGPRVRRMSVKLGLRTEASSRNEKNLPPALADVAAARAASLLSSEGAAAQRPRAYGRTPEPPPPIEISTEHVERLLGFPVRAEELEGALGSLGFDVRRTLPPQLGELLGLTESDVRAVESFVVGVPYWRADVLIAADLVEEVARVVGYDRVAAVLPPVEEQQLESHAFDREMELAQTLAGLGYFECMTLALQPRAVAQRWRECGIDVPEIVEITNPLSEDQRWMRFSLLPALLAHAARERATRPLRTFELGHVFEALANDPLERNLITVLATQKHAGEPAWTDANFLALKSDVLALVLAATGVEAVVRRGRRPGLHPGKTAEIVAGGTLVGHVGAVDPRLLRAYELDDAAAAAVLDIDALPARITRPVVPLSRFPAVERDLAFVVDEVTAAGDMLAAARETPLVRRVDVFDEYRGPQIGAGKKSLAMRVTLQRDDATLTDADADAAAAAIVATLTARFGAVLRG